jgi:hypothetical protein
MVAWWKRILLSLLSVVVGTVVCLLGAEIVIWIAVKTHLLSSSHSVSFHSSELLITIAVIVVFCVVAWLFSVPVVLIVRNISGWRFWFYWVLGSCIGPALMLALCAVILMVAFRGRGTAIWYSPEETPLIYIAAAISSVSSLLYLSLLRRSQAAAARKRELNVAP